MGYHVRIVRGDFPSKGRDISSDGNSFIEAALGRLGFSIEAGASGSGKQLYRRRGENEVCLFLDDGEVWAKNPDETDIEAMIEIAEELGGGARVRGDEGETYRSATETYIHPDDLGEAVSDEESSRRVYWKDILSWIVPMAGGMLILFGIGRIILKHLGK